MGSKEILRKMTRPVRVGNLIIGGGAPVTVQSMLNTKTSDIGSSVKQVKMLQDSGCELIRCAVPDAASADALGKIKKYMRVPLVADIHFDYKLALMSIEAGADKVRINPGTLKDFSKIKEIIKKAKEKNVAIRIGLNSGSLPQKYVHRKNRVKSLVDGMLETIGFFEENRFYDLVLSVKSSNLEETVAAYKKISQKTDYPLHLGLTEAGTLITGLVKSTLAIGGLLKEGIGDTMRISLTSDPVNEVTAALELLKALGIRKGPEMISCPVCARCEIDLEKIARKIEKEIQKLEVPLKVAVMGCAVNGPGEAKEADIGIAGGRDSALLFKQGRVVRKISSENIEKVLLQEIRSMVKSEKNGKDAL